MKKDILLFHGMLVLVVVSVAAAATDDATAALALIRKSNAKIIYWQTIQPVSHTYIQIGDQTFKQCINKNEPSSR